MNRARKVMAVSIMAAVAAGGLFTADPAVGIGSDSGDDPPHLEGVGTYDSDAEYRQSVDKAHQDAVKHQSVAREWCAKRYRFSSRYGGCPRIYYGRKLTNSKNLNVEERKSKLWRRRSSRSYVSYVREVKYWSSLNKSMWRSVNAAAREYGVSADWLHACVASEGGHGGWVMNHQGSGAGGWFQFMESTFYGNVNAARSGNRFPRRYAKWNSRVGQAYTAAYMFKIGQSHQWTGAGC